MTLANDVRVGPWLYLTSECVMQAMFQEIHPSTT
jgi:hypothetical protein